MDTFTHQFCANGHGGTIGTGFPYIRRVDRRTLAPVQFIVLSTLLRWQSLLYSLQPSSQPFYKVSIRPSLLHFMLRNTHTIPKPGMCITQYFPPHTQALAWLQHMSRTYLGGRSNTCGSQKKQRYKTCGNAQRRYWQYGSQKSWRRKPFA